MLEVKVFNVGDEVIAWSDKEGKPSKGVITEVDLPTRSYTVVFNDIQDDVTPYATFEFVAELNQ